MTPNTHAHLSMYHPDKHVALATHIAPHTFACQVHRIVRARQGQRAPTQPHPLGQVGTGIIDRRSGVVFDIYVSGRGEGGARFVGISVWMRVRCIHLSKQHLYMYTFKTKR